MAEMTDIGIHHFLSFYGSCLKSNQLIAVVEGGNHAGGDKLENNVLVNVIAQIGYGAKIVDAKGYY